MADCRLAESGRLGPGYVAAPLRNSRIMLEAGVNSWLDERAPAS